MTFEERVKAHYETVEEWVRTYSEHGLGLMEWIVERMRRLEADRDNWRRQALTENARAEEIIDGIKMTPKDPVAREGIFTANAEDKGKEQTNG